MYPYFGQNIPAKYDIIHVNGENGARALQMASNSNALLLDDTAPIVWLAQTDGAGYKTVTAFDIKPHEPDPVIDMKTILSRLEKIEEKMNESNTTNAKRTKSNITDAKVD